MRQVAQQLLDRARDHLRVVGRRAAAASWSGFSSRARVPSAIMLAVVSCPAISSSTPMLAASARVISPAADPRRPARTACRRPGRRSSASSRLVEVAGQRAAGARPPSSGDASRLSRIAAVVAGRTRGPRTARRAARRSPATAPAARARSTRSAGFGPASISSISSSTIFWMAGPQRLDPLDGERRRHHPAQPGVLGVVHVDEAPGSARRPRPTPASMCGIAGARARRR